MISSGMILADILGTTISINDPKGDFLSANQDSMEWQRDFEHCLNDGKTYEVS